ncbi:MAG TPA: hypothetical protein VL426_04555 [Candidatus Binatia bacterium]|nr:hypothetical protein [Candidatus Binatia bacterium]
MNRRQTEIFAAAALLSFAIVGVYLAATRNRAPSSAAPPAPVPAPVSYAPEGWKLWQDGEGSKADASYAGYSLSYPRDFDVYRGEDANGGWIGKPRVKFAFPADSFKETPSNYAEAFLTVSVGDDPASLKDCYADPKSGAPLADKQVVNGNEFRRGTVDDAGAGQRYATRFARILKAGRCYEVAMTVHTGAVENFDPPVAEFDKEKAFSVLEKMFTTFALTDKAP